MVEKVKIHGLEGIREALKRLPKNVREKELDRALNEGAKLIKRAAVARAPVGDTGFSRMLRGKEWNKRPNNLKRSIAIRAEKKKFKLDAARRRIGVLSSSRDANVGAWYWRFVEFDHIAAGRGGKKGKFVPARPFLVPAFESTKYIANKAIQEALLKGVFDQAKVVKSRAKLFR